MALGALGALTSDLLGILPRHQPRRGPDSPRQRPIPLTPLGSRCRSPGALLSWSRYRNDCLAVRLGLTNGMHYGTVEAFSIESAPEPVLAHWPRDFHSQPDERRTMARTTVPVSQRTDHYKQITDSILAALDAGTKPWARPWTTKAGAEIVDAGLPFNALGGRNYRGLNVPLLWAEAAARGYSRHAWLSFKQAQDLGGSVRKGERATHVFFFKMLDREAAIAEGGIETKRIPLIRAFPVFNADQCDGVRLPTHESHPVARPDASGDLGICGPVVDALALAGGLSFGGSRACYHPSADSILLPRAEAFTSRGAFHATLLHECGHATGHRDRLARDFSGRFGDDAYAFEELVAELSSAMAQAVLGIRADVDNHASYIESWQRVLRADKYAFAKACSLAQAATDYLLRHSDEAEDAEALAVPMEQLQAAA